MRTDDIRLQFAQDFGELCITLSLYSTLRDWQVYELRVALSASLRKQWGIGGDYGHRILGRIEMSYDPRDAFRAASLSIPHYLDNTNSPSIAIHCLWPFPDVS